MVLNKPVGVRFPPDLDGKLDKLAVKLNLNKSILIRNACEYIVKKWEKKNGVLK